MDAAALAASLCLRATGAEMREGNRDDWNRKTGGADRVYRVARPRISGLAFSRTRPIAAHELLPPRRPLSSSSHPGGHLRGTAGGQLSAPRVRYAAEAEARRASGCVTPKRRPRPSGPGSRTTASCAPFCERRRSGDRPDASAVGILDLLRSGHTAESRSRTMRCAGRMDHESHRASKRFALMRVARIPSPIPPR